MAQVVLVHGFWADGSSWSDVAVELDRAGHRVVAVQLPLSSFADDVACVRRALDRAGGPVVLVGHSYGGVVISEAASGRSDVSALVYVSAYGPDKGEDVTALNDTYPPAGAGRAIRPTQDGHLWLDDDLFAPDFAADVEPARARAMALTQGPASVACLTGLTVDPAWKTIPSWFVISTQDRTIAPDAQRFMAQRMGATTVEVEGSHAALVSRPHEIASVIISAAAR